MTTYTQELLRVVEEIHNDPAAQGESKCKTYVNKYPDIAAKYPMIIKKSTLEANFDIERLKWMIGVLCNVDEKSLTKHEADIVVGEKLVDEHVKPLLESTSSS